MPVSYKKLWKILIDRMKNGAFLDEDYFEYLLDEIREIRTSERRFYQKITDIYATAMDYDINAPTTKEFFAIVQNKLHFAIHGHTAAEVIINRADATKEYMGANKNGLRVLFYEKNRETEWNCSFVKNTEKNECK
jgi:hypothetical protein